MAVAIRSNPFMQNGSFNGNLVQSFGMLLITTAFFQAISNIPMAKAIDASKASEVGKKIGDTIQESPVVQELCKTISRECHDWCKESEGLHETVCFMSCVAFEKARQLPFDFESDLAKPIQNKVENYVIGKFIDGVVNIAGKIFGR